MTLTPEDRALLRALAEQATPGPWEIGDDGSGGVWVTGPDRNANVICDIYEQYVDGGADENAAFIAEARTALPALLDALDAREAEVERLRGIVRDLTQMDEVGQHDSLRCRFCGQEGNGYHGIPPKHNYDCLLNRPDIRALLGEKAGE